MNTILAIIGVAILSLYFLRRMYWLTKTNEKNIENNTKEAEALLSKSHDALSWLLLAIGGGLLLLALSLK